MRELRDIIENYSVPSEEELRYLQRKIANAGEMKTAIRKLADTQVAVAVEIFDAEKREKFTPSQYVVVRRKYLNRAIKAMEAYLNTEVKE